MLTQLWFRRLAAGLTQAELAAAVRVSRQTVNAIERGRRRPSLRLALAIAQALETEVTELYDERAQLRGARLFEQ